MNNEIILKTQKIVSAIYLVTDFIKDNDCLKWEIREEGVLLMSNIVMFKSLSIMDIEHSLKNISIIVDKIISLICIAQISNLITKMNADILIDEIKKVYEKLDNKELSKIPPGYILSDSFFSTESLADKGQNTKRQNDDSSVTFNNDLKKSSNITESVKKTLDVVSKKNNRKQAIISLLRVNSNLTIKDFTDVIKDCSEKTIQRELISLVDSGVVLKTGERRWSRYSLAQ